MLVRCYSETSISILHSAYTLLFYRMDSRYLLITVKDAGARRILMESCKRIEMRPEVVFGSGFSGDKHFSQVCCYHYFSDNNIITLIQ